MELSAILLQEGQPLVWLSLIGLALLIVAVAAAVLAWIRARRKSRRLAAESKVRTFGPEHMPQPVLVGISGEFQGNSIELTDEPVLIGRDPKVCQLVFPLYSENISKRHCLVRFHAKSQCFLVVDCNSANGTFIANGERLPNGGSQLLNAGQRFYLSDTGNLFEVNFKAPK